MKKPFSISPRILSHLGEDLIKSDSIALLELVKNSYDACATQCEVNFITTFNEEVESIIITDNGIGMDIDVIENIWLTVGTDNKLKKNKTKKCERIPIGEKGIGRLGVHKLGNNIQIYSKSSSSKEVYLNIDWKMLLTAGKIEDFLIEVVEGKTNEFKNSTGTKIVIKDLKSRWNKKFAREVYRALSTLHSPFENNIDDFQLSIITDNNSFFEELPSFEEIKNAAMYFGKCKLKGDRITQICYEFRPWVSLTKLESGRVKETNLIKEKSDFKDYELRLVDSSGNNEPINLDSYKIGEIEFEVMIFETDYKIFNFVNSEKSTIKQYLKYNGGIKVYRDGIRVYNYGEPDNDWLKMDIKRVSRVGGNVSNNIIIGAVRLKSIESLDLKEKTNREGFIENDAYNIFTEAVNYALSLFVKERNVDKEKISTLYKKYNVIEPVLSDLNDVINIAEKEINDEKVKNEILKYLYRINSQYKEVKGILIKSANAGLNLSVVIHEIEKLISQLISCIKNIEIEKAISFSTQLEKIIRGYSTIIKKSSIKEDRLSKIVEKALDMYSFRFKDHNIEILSNYENNELIAYFPEAEAISVIINLLDNSIFWLSYSKNGKRLISVNITDQIYGYNSIVISDNGPGFNIPFEVAINPFITGKPHNLGSGLGLHIADQMMQAIKGKLLFLNIDDIDITVKMDKQTFTTVIALCFPTLK